MHHHHHHHHHKKYTHYAPLQNGHRRITKVSALAYILKHTSCIQQIDLLYRHHYLRLSSLKCSYLFCIVKTEEYFW